MTKRMLIDATHELETRVAIIDEDIIDHYDFVSSAKRQLKGNIYLGKITRIEPSLQAAFVEYGGGKQGFLSFSEIHPDYYQIPIADRKRLMEEAAREAEEDAAREARAERDEESEDRQDTDRSASTDKTAGRARRGRKRTPRATMAAVVEETTASDEADIAASLPDQDASLIASPEAMDVTEAAIAETSEAESSEDAPKPRGRRRPFSAKSKKAHSQPLETASEPLSEGEFDVSENEQEGDENASYDDQSNDHEADHDRDNGGQDREIETVSEEDVVKPRPYAFRRYKIQEVIKPNQIVLVQVIKEERGNKGCSLSTYISLPGRYCVLMPNSPKDGGISRKIGSGTDRKRLKDIAAELKDLRGMSAIIRTAGIDRSRTEIVRDYEYLIKLWNTTRNLALSSTAPALVYEEGDIVKRTIRDYYNGDISEVLVQGQSAHRSAREFMKMIMPSHTARVKHFTEKQPLFSAYGVEEQLADLYNPIAPLPSGGYLVINPTEALISIDVNSGRSTTERNVEETAFKTNIEAAEEVARQLRLRDLGGLVVIDFIDMGFSKHRRSVERVLKDALKSDRAKVQVGHISAFGLMELSRQRLGPSIFETTTIGCEHCTGTGHVRSPDATSVSLIRELESMAFDGTTEIRVRMTPVDGLCLFNRYRHEISRLEQTYPMLKLSFETDEGLLNGTYAFGGAPVGGESRKDGPRRPMPPRRRGRKGNGRGGKPSRGMYQSSDPLDHEPVEYDPEEEIDEELLAERNARAEKSRDEGMRHTDGEGEESREDDRGPRRRRGRRGRRGGRDRDDRPTTEGVAANPDALSAEKTAESPNENGEMANDDTYELDENGERTGRRRRGRRGGRGRNRGPRRENEAGSEVTNATAQGAVSEHSAAQEATSSMDNAYAEQATPASAPVEQSAPEPRAARPAPVRRAVPSSPMITEVATPAPVQTMNAAQPAPRPSPLPDTTVDDGQPKRRGWWSKITG